MVEFFFRSIFFKIRWITTIISSFFFVCVFFFSKWHNIIFICFILNKKKMCVLSFATSRCEKHVNEQMNSDYFNCFFFGFVINFHAIHIRFLFQFAIFHTKQIFQSIIGFNWTKESKIFNCRQISDILFSIEVFLRVSRSHSEPKMHSTHSMRVILTTFWCCRWRMRLIGLINLWLRLCSLRLGRCCCLLLICLRLRCLLLLLLRWLNGHRN